MWIPSINPKLAPSIGWSEINTLVQFSELISPKIEFFQIQSSGHRKGGDRLECLVLNKQELLCVWVPVWKE